MGGPKRRKQYHTKVWGLLNIITMDELKQCLQQLDSTSSAGNDDNPQNCHHDNMETGDAQDR
jgi:hypothetical protein